MSAIAGIVNFDGAPVDRDLFAKISEAGIRRGPDAEGHWIDGNVAFAYRGISPLWEGSTDDQPYRDPETGIVAMLDGRVDARAELLAKLTAAGHPPRTSFDLELVLRAYLAWGDDAPKHLLGEYAFALWDPRHRRLLLARDPMGVRPLFYLEGPRRSFRFATGANQLLLDPALPPRLDHLGAVDFLISRSRLDPHRTVCAYLKRLPPAQTLTAESSAVRLRRYWAPEDDPELKLPSLDEACGALEDALLAALRDRLRGLKAAGLSLGGGWDSGTLFYLWQWRRSIGETLPTPWTHTHYGDYPENDERVSVKARLHRWPAEASFLHFDPSDYVVGIEKHTQELGLPDPVLGWRLGRLQAQEARQRSLRVILNGEGGNFVAETPLTAPAAFLVRSQLSRLAHQVILSSRMEHRSRTATLWSTAVRPVLVELVPHMARRLIRHFRTIFRPAAEPLFLSAYGRDLARALRTFARSRLPAPYRRFGFAARAGRRALDEVFACSSALSTAPDLEGIAYPAPYFDRRVVRCGLAALDAIDVPGHPRICLERILDRTVGELFSTSISWSSRTLQDAAATQIQARNVLFSARLLCESGIVDRDALSTVSCSPLTFQSAYGTLALAFLEAWLAIYAVQEPFQECRDILPKAGVLDDPQQRYQRP
jgi:hypothetical protein